MIGIDKTQISLEVDAMRKMAESKIPEIMEICEDINWPEDRKQSSLRDILMECMINWRQLIKTPGVSGNNAEESAQLDR